MTERPILFSGPMVRAILEGRKSQTRRVVKPQPTWLGKEWRYDKRDPIGQRTYWWGDAEPPNDKFVKECCPYGVPGDRLWVRETFTLGRATFDDGERDPYPVWHKPRKDLKQPVLFRAEKYANDDRHKWKPAIHMPRWASRLTLELTAVRAERLQAMTEADCIAEGFERRPDISTDPEVHRDAARDWYMDLWDSLNAKRGYWCDVNPWVWVLEFRRA